MSIRDEIKRHLNKEIFLLPPLIRGDQTPRTMFVSKEINAVAWPEWPRGRNGMRLARMRGVLDAFTIGEWLIVSEDPYNKTKDTVLARVDPVNREVWDIRCIESVPGIRVLGRFCAKDEFVALTWDYRETMNGHDFDRAIERFRQKRLDLFPREALFGGDSINDYLSANFRPV